MRGSRKRYSAPGRGRQGKSPETCKAIPKHQTERRVHLSPPIQPGAPAPDPNPPRAKNKNLRTRNRPCAGANSPTASGPPSLSRRVFGRVGNSPVGIPHGLPIYSCVYDSSYPSYPAYPDFYRGVKIIYIVFYKLNSKGIRVLC